MRIYAVVLKFHCNIQIDVSSGLLDESGRVVKNVEVGDRLKINSDIGRAFVGVSM